jgi:hypothetical protein
VYVIGCAVISMIALLLMPKPHASIEDVVEAEPARAAA